MFKTLFLVESIFLIQNLQKKFRDGDMFGYVLAYLRNGSQAIVVSEMSQQCKRMLMLEADFYQLEVKTLINIFFQMKYLRE